MKTKSNVEVSTKQKNVLHVIIVVIAEQWLFAAYPRFAPRAQIFKGGTDFCTTCFPLLRIFDSTSYCIFFQTETIITKQALKSPFETLSVSFMSCKALLLKKTTGRQFYCGTNFLNTGSNEFLLELACLYLMAKAEGILSFPSLCWMQCVGCYFKSLLDCLVILRRSSMDYFRVMNKVLHI